MIAPTDQTPAADEDAPPGFQGFEPITANFLYCPNQFFDVCLSQCNSRGVVRVVAYVLRQQLGWIDEQGNLINKDVTVTYDDLIQKAGVSNGAIGDAIDAAVALGFLRCTREPRPHARNQTAQNGTYELCWDRSGQYITDLKSFRGFHAGSHFTPVPNQFFDDILPNEPLANVKVVGAVIRHTIGYETKFGQRKQRAALSHSFLAQYTHLSEGKILNGAVQSSLAKGYIQCVEQGSFDPRGREFGKASHYAMSWRQQATSAGSSPKRPVKNSGSHRSKKTSDNPPKRPVKERSNKTSNENTSSNDNSKYKVVAVEFQAAFDLLMQVELGRERFNEKTALKLAQSGGLDEIKQQIAWLPKRNADRNPLGMLRSAIENDWSAPIDVKERERNRDGARKEKEETAAEAAQVVEIDRAKRELRQRRKDVLPLWNQLSDEERDGIERSADEKLNSDYHRQQFRTKAEFRLEKCLDEICRREGIIPITSPVT
jgi:hypothetical protein